MGSRLEIRGLHVAVEDKEILKGVDLTIQQGEIHALMGPNGSGKSTLAYALMGHPRYVITQGDVLLDGESILNLSPDKRAKKGLFLAFQYPVVVSGVNMMSFLKSAYTALKQDSGKPPSFLEFKRKVSEKLKLLEMDESFINRNLNEGFSGGEKKRAEILQLAILEPKIAILDETDSGLDIDALKTVSKGVNSLVGPNLGVCLITHYQRILKYVKPHYVHVMLDGRIVVSGGQELALELEEKGYGWIREKYSNL